MFNFAALLVLAMTVGARPPGQLPAPADLTGTWVGSAALSNDWRDVHCRYTGKEKPPSVTLLLQEAGNMANGSIAIDIPAATGSGCPVLKKHYVIRAEITGTRLTFSDPAGNRWTLTRTSDLLKGEVVWDGSAPYPNEALAVGFSTRTGDVPLTRLSGTITLSRRIEQEPPNKRIWPTRAGP